MKRYLLAAIVLALLAQTAGRAARAETYDERRERERVEYLRQQNAPNGNTGIPTNYAAPTVTPGGGVGQAPQLGAPQVPVTGSRPPSWPGGPGSQQLLTPDLAPAAATPSALDPIVASFQPVLTPSGRPIDSTTILARVGSEVVQAVDILPTVDEALCKNLKKFLASADKNAPLPAAEELCKYREQGIKQQLPDAIRTKLLFAEAKQGIPTENFPKVEEQIGKGFYSDQVKRLMDIYKVENRAELDAKFRSFGSSLDAQKRLFFEKNLAYGWLRQQVKFDGEITHEEMLKYYGEHIADYEIPAKARWEHLSVKFDKHSSKDEMNRLLCDWGNQVLSGAPMAEVAKAHSEDFSAADGGKNDWTSRKSLASPILDEALFTLPIGRLSQVLEDDRGLHIIRVTERTEATRTPFLECQDGIKKKIKDAKVESQMKTYIAKLEAKVPVWTIFDPPTGPEAAKPNAGAPNGSPQPPTTQPQTAPGSAVPYAAQAPTGPRR